MKVCDVMTRDVAVVRPDDTVRRAARMMDELNVGSLPVCDGRRLVGMITDRDITVRAVAAGDGPGTKVCNAMSQHVRWCYEDAPVEEVMATMKDVQIRRIPVVDHQKTLVGIVALGDLAAGQEPGVEDTLKCISEPSLAFR
jgi:CBS domain-containing protein